MNEKLFNSLSKNLQDYITNGDYVSAFNNASYLDERRAIIELYLENTFAGNWNKVEPIKDILIKLCDELDELDNEFVKYVRLYIETNNGNAPTRNGIIALNNLYAKGTIDEHNLDATDEDGDPKKSIIFNNKLFNKSRSDIEFIITSYYWLSQIYNLKKINYNALTSSDISEIKSIASKVLSGEMQIDKSIRNVIIFDILENEVNNDTNNYDVREVNTIKNILHLASSRTGETQQQQTNNVSKLLADIAKLSDADKEALRQFLQGL